MSRKMTSAITITNYGSILFAQQVFYSRSTLPLGKNIALFVLHIFNILRD
uniref:Uncharacterized protein n=1 Tax=Rhizophora mucronata TaxID=61149 RepID=A0A2P2K2Q1_RHIMU